ncbi:MAG TPA: hypothetical protein VGV41_22565 [Pseudolabrys sp.]|uniref:hypothetical protein n=1 Tax=Pseudolabrys sp. TaxID=1960880 RepID=UPI002DDC90AC|nr:hypothetical protein [Pseudolabrys sp.]HEV2631417.1 hypothetical protein [Pseudolabrys sp.]
MLSTRVITERLDLEAVRLARRAAIAHDIGHRDFFDPNARFSYPIVIPEFLQNSPDAVDDVFNVSNVLAFADVLSPFRATIVRADEDWLYLPTLHQSGTGCVLNGFVSSQKLHNPRQFWSFFYEIDNAHRLTFSYEAISGKSLSALSLASEVKPHWADFDQVFHISTKEIESFWEEAALRYADRFSSLYEMVSALQAIFSEKIYRIARIRARFRSASGASDLDSSPNTHRWVLTHSLRTGVSPPEKSECPSFTCSQPETSNVVLWKSVCARRMRGWRGQKRADVCRCEGGASIRHSRCRDKSRRRAICGSWAYRKTCAVKACSLLHSRHRSVVDHLRMDAA